jgi:prepilin-type N-terminal cleavage/methylation domain-containing protein
LKTRIGSAQLHHKEKWKMLASALRQKGFTLIELLVVIATIAIQAIITGEQGTARFPHKKQYFPRPYAADTVLC